MVSLSVNKWYVKLSLRDLTSTVKRLKVLQTYFLSIKGLPLFPVFKELFSMLY